MGKTSPKLDDNTKVICRGGRSFGITHMDEHHTSEKYYCYRCNTDLGCKLCAQIRTELICLNCRDWGTTAAMAQHGPIVADREVGQEGFRIAMMVFKGSVTQQDGEKLMQELFFKHRPKLREVSR